MQQIFKKSEQVEEAEAKTDEERLLGSSFR